MSAASGSHRPRVLLVDSDFRTSQRLARLLEEDGFTVELAREGAAAIARLSRAPAPSVVITELLLPLADGATVARFARAQNPNVQLVVLTRYANQPLSPAFGAEPLVVLSKPLDYGQLLEVLAGEVPTASARAAFRG